MGKQIRFFLAPDDELCFESEIRRNNYVLIDEMANPLSDGAIADTTEQQLYITYPDAQIILSKGGYVDAISSDVIQWSRCKAREDNTLSEGRIWVEMRHWNEEQELVTKNDYLSRMYDVLVKYIKKNTKRSIDKPYSYIGASAYASYKNENCKMVHGPRVNIEFD